MTPEAEQLQARLTNVDNAIAPPEVKQVAPKQAGMYAWWADEHARTIFSNTLQQDVPSLVYIGQAGATKWPSGTKSSSTLKSRVGGQHVGGNARSSTFRLTISGLLLEELDLQVVDGGKLETVSNKHVTDWIAAHMQVVLAPFDNRDDLGNVEEAIVQSVDPPLNLGHCLTSEARKILTARRRRIRHNG